VVIATAYAVVIFSILVQATSLHRVIEAVLPPAKAR
jgi:NhaP-type Na+/H+ or K+/H+ antiporter